jgi:hypothetical protein
MAETGSIGRNGGAPKALKSKKEPAMQAAQQLTPSFLPKLVHLEEDEVVSMLDAMRERHASEMEKVDTLCHTFYFDPHCLDEAWFSELNTSIRYFSRIANRRNLRPDELEQLGRIEQLHADAVGKSYDKTIIDGLVDALNALSDSAYNQLDD